MNYAEKIIGGLVQLGRQRETDIRTQIDCKSNFAFLNEPPLLHQVIEAFSEIGVEPIFDEVNKKHFVHFDLEYSTLSKISVGLMTNDYVVFSCNVSDFLTLDRTTEFDCILWNTAHP